MKYKLNENNNSKKLIIGVSIIFCTVILIIGVTTAFFTQSGSGTTGNIVTTDIRDTLEYTDDTTYMRQGLIPAKEEIAKQAYNITGDNKCLDSLGYSACSVYQFTIKNNANVSQELIIDMIPTVNTFTNLYFILYEIDNESNSSEIISSQKIEKITDINNIPTYNLKSELTLNPSIAKTYQVVFFINDTGLDQTLEDAGKNFGATIKITSVSTGTYIVETFGESCWTTELLSDGTYKLTEFHGINNDSTDTDNYGKINESCTGYVEQDTDGLYSVTIPSNVGGQQVSTLGNALFQGVNVDADTEAIVLNNYSKINNIQISEGITEIEDGSTETFVGTFLGVGVETMDESSGPTSYYDNVSVTLPSTLTKIGNIAFYVSGINNITFNNNESNLKTIGEYAFAATNLSSITILSSVETIGNNAFGYSSNLTTLTFSGAEDGTSKLTTIGESAFINCNITTDEANPLVIPRSVETINGQAFKSNSNLTKVTFSGAEDGTSKLQELGYYAFNSCNLTYPDENNYLLLPSTITTTGFSVFADNSNLKYIKFTGNTSGFGHGWNGSATIITE